MLIGPCYVIRVLITLGLGRSGMARQACQPTRSGSGASHCARRDRSCWRARPGAAGASGRALELGRRPASAARHDGVARPMTKPITSVAALQLAEQRGLDRGQPGEHPAGRRGTTGPPGIWRRPAEAAPACAAADRSPPAVAHRRALP